MARTAGMAATIVLVLIALLHLLWAFEIPWPAKDMEGLKAAAWGEESDMPGFLPTIIVVALLILAGWLEYSHAVGRRMPGPVWISKVMLYGVMAVFLLRGILGFFPSFHGSMEPFITNNRLYYSPLCLLIALLTAIVLWKGPKPVR